MANPTTDFIEFPDSGNLTADRTYVVRTNHTLTSTTSIIPANITLIFMGGMLLKPSSSSPTLTGNRTRIVAPPEQIFSADLTVGGTWEIERAFPQWFGAKSYPTYNSTFTDSAPAIKNAILMKGTGEVFLPRGYYRVDSCIDVKAGITLLGETGGRDQEIPNNSGLYYARGTILMAGSTMLSNYTDGYMMRINVSNGSWEYEYPDPGTIIRNIVFFNTWRNIEGLKGICAAGGFALDNCSWKWIKQAVCALPVYSDQRKIVNCTFSAAGSMNQSESKLYAFELNSLGDSLVFENNAMHDFGSNVQGLYINRCNGGTITSNIINNDVKIDGSKAVIYSANHMEKWAQLEIVDSNVKSMSNFFWKGKKPSLIVRSASNGHTPVVKSSNDSFLFYDNSPSEEAYIPINTVNKFDIQISSRCNLEFSQSYRFWVRAGAITQMSPHGLAVCKEDGTTPVNDFNYYSYNLSSEGRIMPGYHVMSTAYSNKLNIPTSYAYNVDNNTKWTLSSGNYYYKWQILWDRKRKIVGNSGTFTPYSQNPIPQPPPYITLTQNQGGLLFHLANSETSNGVQAMIRLYRGTSLTYTQYVDIPLAGAYYLYDNGFSVCGFKWETLTSDENLLTVNTNIISISYKGINIECKGTAAPPAGVGSWEEGDIVFNTNTGTNTTHWIYLSGAWRAKP